MFIFPYGTWKDNIKSVILDWRQRSARRSSKRGDLPVSQAEGTELLLTQADLSAPSVCSPTVTLLQKKGPHHRRKICADSLWLYSYYTQPSPSKNENINYICIYLRVLRYLSIGAIYYITKIKNQMWFSTKLKEQCDGNILQFKTKVGKKCCEMKPGNQFQVVLVWFYDISTIVVYLMPNPFYTYCCDTDKRKTRGTQKE